MLNMYTYKVNVEDMKSKHDAEIIREAQSRIRTAVVTYKLAKEVLIDSDFSVEEIYQIIEDAGYIWRFRLV